jgi:hypothetical protein
MPVAVRGSMSAAGRHRCERRKCSVVRQWWAVPTTLVHKGMTVAALYDRDRPPVGARDNAHFAVRVGAEVFLKFEVALRKLHRLLPRHVHRRMGGWVRLCDRRRRGMLFVCMGLGRRELCKSFVQHTVNT